MVGSGLVVTQVEGGVAEHWTWLSAAAASGRQVAWLVADDGEPGLLRVVADQLNRDPRPPYEVEILHGSYDVPGARLIDLVRVMDRLRRNCPWDQEQTHESLAKYLLEETYETLEAIDTGDRAHLREELGDLMLQVAFHSRIAEEDPDDGFSIDDVSGDIVEKLIRRHPHVFGTVDAADAAAVEANWETIKAAEKQRSSVLEGIPLALPALALADKILGRAAKVARPPEADASVGTLACQATTTPNGIGADPQLAASPRRRGAWARRSVDRPATRRGGRVRCSPGFASCTRRGAAARPFRDRTYPALHADMCSTDRSRSPGGSPGPERRRRHRQSAIAPVAWERG